MTAGLDMQVTACLGAGETRGWVVAAEPRAGATCQRWGEGLPVLTNAGGQRGPRSWRRHRRAGQEHMGGAASNGRASREIPQAGQPGRR